MVNASGFSIERAKKGIYPERAFKDMPPEWKAKAFETRENNFHIKEFYQQDVQFLEQDIRKDMPEGEFELILCRNLVFTYFQDDLQREIYYRMMTKLKPGGIFIYNEEVKRYHQIELFGPTLLCC